MNHEENLMLLSQMIEVVKADNEVNEAEMKLILGVGQLMNISKEKILELFKNPLPFTPPASEFDRILQFHRLILAINVDRVITSEEIQMIRQQGLAMGLAHQQIETVFDEMKKHEHNMIPPQRMIELFRTYNN